MHYHELIVDYSKDPTLQLAIDELSESYELLGSKFFEIDEEQVDKILGQRAYSGGDIPLEVIEEVEKLSSTDKKSYYFKQINPELLKELSKLEGLSYEVQEHADEDWNAKWKESYKPIKISNKILVSPSWQEVDDVYETIIKIYPGMGFGTGTHETTFLCLKLFSEITQRGKLLRSCLDFGCGSGILGIAHLLTGGKSCDLIDIDEGALINTHQNLELNLIEESDNVRVLTSHQKQLARDSYDLIFANILQDVLFLEKGFLSNSLAEGGLLILSGILKEQVEETIAYYQKASNLDFVKALTLGDWAAILMRR